MLNLNFSEFPQLTTDRLLLRNTIAQDLASLHQLRSDQDVNILVGRETPTTLSQTEAFIVRIQGLIEKKESLYWVLSLKGQDRLIGTACCWNFDVQNEVVEIGYEMLPEFQGRGLMKEALQKLIAYTFDVLNAQLITAFPSGVNVKSIALLKSLNFQLEDQSYSNSHTDIADLVTYVLKK